MTRLPRPHQDANIWGDVLNQFLLQEHDTQGRLLIRNDGTLEIFYVKPSQGIPIADLHAQIQASLQRANQAIIQLNGKTATDGMLALTKSDLGLSNVENTADADKPVSTAVQIALTNAYDEALALAIAL